MEEVVRICSVLLVLVDEFRSDGEIRYSVNKDATAEPRGNPPCWLTSFIF